MKSANRTPDAYDAILDSIGIDASGEAPSQLAIGFTGCKEREGVSTVATNVAIRAASLTGNVLLVDANFARPTVARKLRIRNVSQPGMWNMLAGDAEPEDCISDTDVPGLSALLPGQMRRRKESVFEGINLHTVVEILKFEFRLLVFDLPVIGHGAYAARLAQALDGVMLVVAAGGSRRDQIQLAKRRLDESGGNTLGVVFNKA